MSKGIRIKLTSPNGEEVICQTINEAVKFLEPKLGVKNLYTQIYSCIRPLRKTIHNWKVEEIKEGE